jgi:mono/diheme cytochrome c family protein
MKKTAFQKGIAGILMAVASSAYAQDFPPEQIKLGADMYARHCSPCHGIRMKNPEGAFDLMTFPKDQDGRFRHSVAKGKNSMPPWESLLKPEDIDALWAYVVAGEKK